MTLINLNIYFQYIELNFCNSIMTYGVAKLRNREFRIAQIQNKEKISVCVKTRWEHEQGVMGKKNYFTKKFQNFWKTCFRYFKRLKKIIKIKKNLKIIKKIKKKFY